VILRCHYNPREIGFNENFETVSGIIDRVERSWLFLNGQPKCQQAKQRSEHPPSVAFAVSSRKELEGLRSIWECNQSIRIWWNIGRAAAAVRFMMLRELEVIITY
jgi:hypothetical protein